MLDKISSLPDDVLISYILCRLPLQDVARTTILSKRWRSLFSCIPHLVFDDNFFNGWRCTSAYSNKWLEIVEDVVCSPSRREGQSSVVLDNFTITDMHSDRILKILLESSSIQKLHLALRAKSNYLLPHCLYKCESLVDLKLCACSVKLPSELSILPNLKRLELSAVSIAKPDLEIFVSRCKGLEELVLRLHSSRHTRYWEGTLYLRSTSLVSIEFERESFTWDISLEGVGPSLRRVRVLLYNHDLDIALPYDGEVMDPEVYARVREEPQKFVQLLTGFGSVECLSLQILDVNCETFPIIPERLPGGMLLINLKKLVLKLSMFGYVFNRFLSFLLRTTPNLEELIIDICFLESPFSCWEDRNFVVCVVQKLKWVELRSIGELTQCFEFAKFILKNAQVLEKITIEYVRGDGDEDVDLELLRHIRKSDNTILEIEELCDTGLGFQRVNAAKV